MERKEILVLAYAVSPTRGSEYAVAWNYITHMSRYHNLTVICGTSGDHLGDLDELKRYLAQSPMENVTFELVEPSRIANILNYPNRKGWFPYMFYAAFGCWQRSAYKHARKLASTHHFDLVHTLGPIGYREPGYLWKLDMPRLWGPIGGITNYPRILFDILTPKVKTRFIIRAMGNTMQRNVNARVRKAFRANDVVLACTTETARQIKKYFGVDSEYMPENCIDDTMLTGQAKADRFDLPMKLIFVGRTDENKAVILPLRALTQIRHSDKVRFDIIGDGPAMPALKAFVADNNLDGIVRFHGRLPRAEAIGLFANANLNVISSLGEANTTVIFEALANGVPTMALDHCGMHDVITDECGVKIPVGNPEQVVADMAAAIDRLVENPELVRKLAEGAARRAKTYSWEEREKRFNELYDEAITKYNNKKNH